MGCNPMVFRPFTTACVLVITAQFGLESESQLCNCQLASEPGHETTTEPP